MHGNGERKIMMNRFIAYNMPKIELHCHLDGSMSVELTKKLLADMGEEYTKEEKIISFLFLVPSSMLSTVSALGAQNIGAKKPERAQQTLKYAIMIAFGFGLVAETTKKFCLTFLKKTNIITDERVANLRKSSFAARFYFVYAGKSV